MYAVTLPLGIQDWFLEIAKGYIGTWYTWGGDDPEGFDCSGLALEVGKSVGVFPRGGWDRTAAGIYEYLKRQDKIIPTSEWGQYPSKSASFVFWSRGDAKQIHHVGIVVTPGRFVIEAAGGGSFIHNKEDAIKHNAFVKLRPLEFDPDKLTSRGMNVFFADPFK